MTTDIVWAYRWIIAKIQEYDITVYVTGIDMSSAFDTMERNKLLEVVAQFMCEDNQRILRVLLSETSVEIKIKGAESQAFKSNIGGPQGDSYSGPQFTTYFEHSLKAKMQSVAFWVLVIPGRGAHFELPGRLEKHGRLKTWTKFYVQKTRTIKGSA